uniref:Cilia- and flagella-associated protein 97 n=1 Tax=Dromaius novaehollandiae TaxID=8790 RepID=A0A8C4JGK0_DRONO
MHRAYQPILPCGNKYLQLKWDKAKYEEHKKRILAAKPLVDTSTPATYGHLHLKLGKLKLEEDRLSVIERDNRLLLEKMSCIMRTKGQIDNKNDYKAKSLNGEKRKKELLRVSQENRAILDRITKSEPQYQVQRWYEDWQKAEKYMANIARYPRGQCKAHSQKEEQFKKQVPKQDRKREKQLKEKSMKRKMKDFRHGKGRDQLEQDNTPEMAQFPQSPVKAI